jgi:hypothetical protein
MIDVIEAVVAYLKSDAGVAALVGTRVYGGELPRSQAATMPQGTVVVSPAGGGLLGLSGNDYGDSRVDIDCYSTTPHQAYKLNLAVYDAMKAIRRRKQGTALLHWSRPSSTGATGRDTDWPITVSSYQVLAAEVAA